jgi:hypothetical protein
MRGAAYKVSALWRGRGRLTRRLQPCAATTRATRDLPPTLPYLQRTLVFEFKHVFSYKLLQQATAESVVAGDV